MSNHSYLTGTVYTYFLSDKSKKKNKKELKKALKHIRNVRGSEKDMDYYINAVDDTNFTITVDGQFRDTKSIRTVLCIEKWLKDLDAELQNINELAGVDAFNICVCEGTKKTHITASDFEDCRWTEFHTDLPTLMQAFREKDEEIIAHQKENGFEVKAPDTEEQLLKRCFGIYCEYLSFTGNALFDEKAELEDGHLVIRTRKRKPKRITNALRELVDYSVYYWSIDKDTDMTDQVIHACDGCLSDENILKNAGNIIW